MIRRVLIDMMGNDSSKHLPDNPPDDVKGEARFWVPGPVDDEKFLRPDFGAPWGKNSYWHNRYNFIFHKDWQSSDYISSDDSSGPESEDQHSAKKLIKSNNDKIPILKTCQPDYRSQRVRIYCYQLYMLS